MVDGVRPSSYSERPDITDIEDFRRRLNLASDLQGNDASQTPAPRPCTMSSSSIGARRPLGQDATGTTQQGC